MLLLGGRAFELRPKSTKSAVKLTDDDNSGLFMRYFGKMHVVFFLPLVVLVFFLWVITGAFIFAILYVPLSVFMALFWQCVQAGLLFVWNIARNEQIDSRNA